MPDKIVISINDDDKSVREGVADLVGTIGFSAHNNESPMIVKQTFDTISPVSRASRHQTIAPTSAT